MIYKSSFILLFLFSFFNLAESAELSTIGKVRKIEGNFYFLEKTEKGNTIYLLPKSPNELFVETSGNDQTVLENIKGLIMPRWNFKGVYEHQGKQRIITQVFSFKPQGPGYLRTEEREFIGRLTIKNENSADRSKISFWVKSDNLQEYFIPGKKFKPEPNGFSIEKALELKDKTVKMKAKVQIREQGPHRVATLTAVKRFQ